MEKIVVTTEKLLECEGRLKDYSKRLRAEFERAYAIIKNIDYYFLFAGGECIKGICSENERQYEADCEGFDKHIGSLSLIAQEYDTAEKENKDVCS